jgi:hypothetical protein
MLSVYTRHSEDCKHVNDKLWRRCRFPRFPQSLDSQSDGYRDDILCFCTQENLCAPPVSRKR